MLVGGEDLTVWQSKMFRINWNAFKLLEFTYKIDQKFPTFNIILPISMYSLSMEKYT